MLFIQAMRSGNVKHLYYYYDLMVLTSHWFLFTVVAALCFSVSTARRYA